MFSLLVFLGITACQDQITLEGDGIKNSQDTATPTNYTLSMLTGGLDNSIIGNVVNSFYNPIYNPNVRSAINSTENAERIYIKGGAGIHNKIKLFSSPEAQALMVQIKANRWVINGAKLVFHPSQQTLGATKLPKPPRLYLYNAETLQPLLCFSTEVYESHAPLGVFKNYSGMLQAQDEKGEKYRIGITDCINNMILRDSTNANLALGVTLDIRANATASAKLANGETIKIPNMAISTPLGRVLYRDPVRRSLSKQKIKTRNFLYQI